MNCKHCQAELPEDSLICPACGTDNQEPAAEVAPAKEKEKKTKEGIVLTPGKLGLIIACVAVISVLAVMLVLLVIGGLGNGGEATEPSETVETVPGATYAADTGLNDETCKGTYTASDEEVIAAKDVVVATMGDAKLTNGELQIYYWIEVQGFLSQYGYYLSMMGLDYTMPLDQQPCPMVEGLTWQQYFLSCAISNWKNYQALELDAKANDFKLEAEYQEFLDTFAENFEQDAITNGYADGITYLESNVGKGSSVDCYVRFQERYYTGGLYYDQLCSQIEITDEAADAYFAEHEAEYAEQGITKTSFGYVDVRHILILPSGATVETIRSETFSEEEWAAGKANAERILNEWLSGDKTEESFAELANQYSADTGSNTNGGLYTDVAPGEMVEAFDAWCFDESRKPGDYAIVETELGYHVMYFSKGTLAWPVAVKTELMNQEARQLLQDITAKYPVEVDYTSIVLGYVDMAY